MSSLYANWKLRDVKGQMQEADAVKEHYWITYKFLGKGGARILRKDGTNENGEAVYYDYVSKLSGTLARLSRRLGVTDAAVKDEKIDFEKVKPRRAVAQAATTQADNAAQADKAGGEGRVVEKAEKKRKAADAAGPADRKAPVTNEPEVRAGKKEAQKNKKKAEEKAPEAAGGAGIDFTKPGGIDFTKPSGKEETGGGKAKAEQGSRIDFTKPSGIPFVKPGEKRVEAGGQPQKIDFTTPEKGKTAAQGKRVEKTPAVPDEKIRKGNPSAESWTIVNPYIAAGLVGKREPQGQPGVAIKQSGQGKKFEVPKEDEKKTVRAEAGRGAVAPEERQPVKEVQPAQNEAPQDLEVNAPPAKEQVRPLGVSDAVWKAHLNITNTVGQRKPGSQKTAAAVKQERQEKKPEVSEKGTKETASAGENREMELPSEAPAQPAPAVVKREAVPEKRQPVRDEQPARNEAPLVTANAKTTPAKAPKAQTWGVSDAVWEAYRNAGKTVDQNRAPFTIPTRKVGFVEQKPAQGSAAGTNDAQAGRAASDSEGNAIVTQNQAGRAATDVKTGGEQAVIAEALQSAEPAGRIEALPSSSGYATYQPAQAEDRDSLEAGTKGLFKYYELLAKEGHEKQCAGYAFGCVLPRILAAEGRTMQLVAVPTWKIERYLPNKFFTRVDLGVRQLPVGPQITNPDSGWKGQKYSELSASEKKTVRKQMVEASAGTVITVMYGNLSLTGGVGDAPRHTITSLGNGLWTDNIGGQFGVRDLKKDDEFSEFLKECQIVAGTRMYVPKIDAMPKAGKQEFRATDIGPEAFAAQLSQNLHIPFEYIMNEVISQNQIEDNFRSKRPELKVSLYVPRHTIAEQRAVAASWESDISTPAIVNASVGIRSRVPASEAQLAGRRDEFVAHVGRLEPARQALGINAQSFDALMVILYNEQYSSQSWVEWKKAKESAAILSEGAFKLAEKVHGGKIRTAGSFQVNIDWAVRWLEDVRNRGELLNTMQKLGIGDAKLQGKLGLWNEIPKDERRAIMAVHVLGNEELGLFLANKLYNENMNVLQNIAARYGSPSLNYEDVEMTAVLAYNRGLPQTYGAIFQQNLFEAGKVSGVKLSGKIDGSLGAGSFATFKALCTAKGISEITVRDDSKHRYEIETQTVKIGEMTEKDFERIFSRYENIAAFFSRDEFREFEYKAVFDYTYLSLHQELITPYLKSYFSFVKPPAAPFVGGVGRAGIGRTMD